MQFGSPIYVPSNGKPASTHDKLHLRFHFSHYSGGNPIFVPTAEISTRTLASVGGIRPGCNYTKRHNRLARKRGYPDYKALIHAMMRQARGDMAVFRRLMSGQA